MKIIKSQDNRKLINAAETCHFFIYQRRKATNDEATTFFNANIMSTMDVRFVEESLTPEESIYNIEADNIKIGTYTTEAQAKFVLDEILLFLISSTNNLFVMPKDLGANYIL